MNLILIIISIVSGIFGIFGSVYGIYMWAKNRGKKEGQRESKLSDIENYHKELECVKNKEFISNVKQTATNLSAMSYNISVIERWIMKKDIKMIDTMAEKHSPLRITPIGEEVIRISHADKILPQIQDLLISEMEKEIIKTAFDAETKAYFAIMRNDDNDAFIPLKKYIYNAPQFVDVTTKNKTVKVELNYDAILRLISIKLRDEYIKLHPEITD